MRERETIFIKGVLR